MQSHIIALIAGDGVGPEVTREAVKTLSAVGLVFGHDFVFVEARAGGAAIDQDGEPLPKKTLEICKNCEAVLLGAVGGSKWDCMPIEKRPERALLGLRKELGLYANLRPAKLHIELTGACPLRREIAARGFDMLVVRELTGGIYFGESGRTTSNGFSKAWDTESYDENEIRRIAEIAFGAAALRRGKVTSVDKANVLESSRLWREIVADVAKKYPGVELSHMYVDNASMQLIRDPGQFDVILASNMFGDILSDEAGQLTGSIGMLPSASLSLGGPGLFEPAHGSAPDIAGKNMANPIASILSAAMLLRHALGMAAEAALIEAAVGLTLAEGYRTADIAIDGGTFVGTDEMGGRIAENLSRASQF